MTAARLSPAASLLRNSKLFALPPAIALPKPEPSSEPVPRSDTATSIYPTRAAIETPLTSLGKGDWGLKRQLPLKSTTKSGSPTVRLNKGIDTAEHIADFDSAADHVLTLKKFQELNLPIQHPKGRDDSYMIHHGAFRKSHDNTTTSTSSFAPAQSQYTGVWPSLSPSELRKQLPTSLQSDVDETAIQSVQPPNVTRSTLAPKVKRWRYDGPSLVQMSGLEFDQWMKGLDSSKRQSFREAVKRDMLARRRSRHVAKAQDSGTVGEVDPATLQVSEEELTQHLRKLRQQPREFGRLIATFLDLPDGPSFRGIQVNLDKVWEYGRHTVASESYESNGPPRTHPSAGLSYIHSPRWAQNHAVFGPQQANLPVAARQVKTRARGNKNEASLGVAGFIVEREAHKGTKDNASLTAFEPQPGGQKVAVRPENAEVNERGALKFTVRVTPEYLIEKEKAVHNSMVSDERIAALRPSASGQPRVMQALQRATVGYKRRDDVKSASSEDLDFLGQTR